MSHTRTPSAECESREEEREREPFLNFEYIYRVQRNYRETRVVLLFSAVISGEMWIVRYKIQIQIQVM